MNSSLDKIFGNEHSCQSYVSKEVGSSSSIEIQSNSNINPHLDLPNYFTISQELLSKLVESAGVEESISISEVLIALKTNVATGIVGDSIDLNHRHKAFGSNHKFEEHSSLHHQAKDFKKLIFKALTDTEIILLLCCATLSLVIGIKRDGLEESLFDGLIMFLSILIVVNLGVIFKYCKARKMMIKNLSRGKITIGVIRHGKLQHISVYEVVVGDIICLQSGDLIPADGLFIQGNSPFKIDDGVVHEVDFGYNAPKHPAMFTGAKVVEGCCRMLVTSVGKNTERGKMMRSISTLRKEEYSKLEAAISNTNTKLEKIWLSLTLMILFVQVIRCFILKSKYCDENHDDPDSKGVKSTTDEIMMEGTKLLKRQGIRVKGLVPMLCVLLFAMRDGLPLGLFILLAFASKKTIKIYRASVQNYIACATSGLVTTICIGETDDLTMRHIKMAELWIGLDNITQLGPEISPEVLDALREAICLIKCDSSLADDSLIWWAQKFLGIHTEESTNCTNLCDESFGSGVLIKRNRVFGNDVHMHLKGPPENVLAMCSHYYHADGTMQTLDEQTRAIFNKILERISSKNFHCFAFAYKHVIQEQEDPPVLDKEQGGNKILKSIDVEDGLTWLGLVGLKNPISPGVREAVKACGESGFNIKLLVDCDMKTAKLMAINSGILSTEEKCMIEGFVIEASEFRNSSEKDRMNIVDNVHVMANASPSDKLLMVQCLRQKGNVVAATGMSIRDSPLMKEADVGFSLGYSAAEMARENSDMVVLDRDFVTIFYILKLGRYVCKNIEKLIQLQLTLNIAAFTINFLTIMSTSVELLTPFDLLWVNLIMDFFPALAWAASMVVPPPSVSTQSESNLSAHEAGEIITRSMWRNIMVHCLYQVTIAFVINLEGKVILSVDETVSRAMIFNCFVFCQVFLLIAAREMEKTFVSDQGRLNIRRFCCFLVIVGVIGVLQAVVMEILAVMGRTERLDIKEWSVCIGIGAVSVLIDGAAKWVGFSCVRSVPFNT